MPELLIVGIPVVGIIIGVVELAKRQGLSTRWAPVVAVGMGIGVSLLSQLAVRSPGFAEWYEAAGAGLVVGLVAAGVYSAQKTLRE